MSQPFPANAASIPSTPPRQSATTMKKSASEKVVGRHDHPYLIRTTSSSLLTRSNSIGAVHKPAVVHTAIGPSSPALGRSQGRGHKKTKSQSAVPPSLPLPPSTPTSPALQDLPPLSPSPSRSPNPGNLRLRLRRSDTLPSMPTRIPESPSKVTLEDLPVRVMPYLLVLQQYPMLTLASGVGTLGSLGEPESMVINPSRILPVLRPPNQRRRRSTPTRHP